MTMEKGKIQFDEDAAELERLLQKYGKEEIFDSMRIREALESDLSTITAERDRLRLALDVLESQLRESRDTLAALGTKEAIARIGATRASDGLSEARAILEGKE